MKTRKHSLLTLTLSLTSLLLAVDPVQANPLQAGESAYRQGNFAEAVERWQEAVEDYQKEGNLLQQAKALSNLALAYEQVGELDLANRMIGTSLEVLDNLAPNADRAAVLGQILNTRGHLEMLQGNTASANKTFQSAIAAYNRAGEENKKLRAQLNQVQVLKEQGRYYEAGQILAEVNQTLQSQPDSLLKAQALSEFGNLLQLVGNLDRGQELLEQSLAVSQTLNTPSAISTTLMALGNIAYSRYEQAGSNQALEEGLRFYEQAAATTLDPIIALQAQVNAFELAQQGNDLQKARSLSAQIQQNLQSLAPSRPLLYAQIRFARLLPRDQISQKTALLKDAAQTAEIIGDQRAHSYALGEQGRLLEQRHQIRSALSLTQQALFLSQALAAPDLSYQWQWQLGRLLERQGDLDSAIAAYAEAVNHLQSLRSDLIAVNKDARFSFREKVEPVYREYVSLLLKSANQSPKTKQDKLKQARDAMESLRLAELVNFLRIDCEVTEAVEIDQVDQNAAVIYPILLPDRLEIIVSIAEQPLKHYTISVSGEEVESTARSFQNQLVNAPKRFQTYLTPAQQLYDWLIRPLKTDLVANEVENLVFVLDGTLRNIPMSALYDGEEYLLENYAIALSPSLRLASPQALPRQSLQALIGGLSESRQGFSSLPAVREEVESIENKVPSTVLLNDRFQENTLELTLEEKGFPVVHLATHGQFSSNLEDTFILTWDDRITINEFPQLLQSGEASRNTPIELLILSACETVKGDDRAALGLAGVAIRAGARSTLGTLWKVSDQGTSQLMRELYQQLEQKSTTKAEALRQSQLSLLNNEKFSHPYYWSAFVLLGNWL
ncbi:CHAT domain-containing protein [Dactylococcopsis salina]|uniref:CHAT domain-containing protein n=1 Tax=Dactylococcopsis salina (strain PCC 8305) TaxID=13035 RepID=K9YVE5_DACS8|nr:CHAT domain-containing protein [Dactylococcopsis salina]AFZ50864.1 hypothetical protein Dacsa_2247 [Dactylococcopsis salina PCC 8305]